MQSPLLKEEIIHHLEKLPSDQQRQVLNFARALEMTRPRGVKGNSLLTFGGKIQADDLQVMARSIEEGCEKVDVNDW